MSIATLPVAKNVTVSQLNAMLTAAGEELDLSMRRPALLEKARELKLIAPRAPDVEEPACSSDQVCIPLRDKDSVIVNWAIIDAADRQQVEALSWYLYKSGPNLYAGSKKNLMHILLMGEAPPGQVIDHRNGCGLLNTRANLRFATRALNSQNKIKKEGTSSKYIGVSSSKWGWVAQHGKDRLGYFKSEVDAAFAYDEKIREVHGDLGKINGIDKPEGFKPYVVKGPAEHKRGVVKSGKKFRAQYWDQDLKTYIRLDVFATEDAAHKAHETYRAVKEAEREAKRLSVPILRNDQGVAIIPVRKGQETTYALVDDAFWYDFMTKSWSIDTSGYVATQHARMHKLVLEADLVDHRNGRLDNRKQSLVVNTHAGNNHNTTRKNATGFAGVKVRPTKSGKRYQAELLIAGSNKSLGTYDDAKVAAYARNCAAKMVYGELARLNDVPNPEGWEWDSEQLRLIHTETATLSTIVVDRKTAFTGVYGVSTNLGPMFKAAFSIKNQSQYLGMYNSAEIAAYARDCAARMFRTKAKLSGVSEPDGWEWDATKMRLIQQA